MVAASCRAGLKRFSRPILPSILLRMRAAYAGGAAELSKVLVGTDSLDIIRMVSEIPDETVTPENSDVLFGSAINAL
eukprot:1151370-Pyramimonas_sp.AAC.1